MDIIGLDLHKRESQLSIKAEGRGDHGPPDRHEPGAVYRCAGGANHVRAFCSRRARRASGSARHPESLGHEVIVADPNYAPMYANRSRRTKTDRRDARTLMDACETGAWRPKRIGSRSRAAMCERNSPCATRLVRTRTRYRCTSRRRSCGAMGCGSDERECWSRRGSPSSTSRRR